MVLVFRRDSLRSVFLNCERVFLIVGLATAGIYAASTMYARLYQAYASRAFDRSLREEEGFPGGEPSSMQDGGPGDGARTASESQQGQRRRARGSTIGRLEIPAAGLSVMVLEGTDAWTLNQGVGHIEGTALPGRTGNTGIAGHRDAFFRGLKKVSKRDRVVLTTRSGRYEYRIADIRIVAPEDTEVLAPSRKPTLTLVTCYPFDYVGQAPKRFVVHAKLSSTKPVRHKPPAMAVPVARAVTAR